MKNKWAVPNVSALLLVLVVNALASLLPINGQTTGEISDRFPVLFKPAGYVFSIWGLIYLLLIAFVVYQALPRQKTNPNISVIGGYFALTCLLNAAWIFAWHYNQFLLSALMMILLLLTLVAISLRITSSKHPMSQQDKWFVKLPFSVYLAWISVATIANLSITLYSLSWGGWGLGDVTWTLILLAIGTVLAVYMVLARKDSPFAMVFIWAFIGIYFEQQTIGAIEQGSIAMVLVITAAVLYSQISRKWSGEGHIF